jgi:hypothetical protein
LRSIGARVPEDIMVIGYDNNDIATAVDPELTTVDNRFFDLGSALTANLLTIIGRPSEKIAVTILPSSYFDAPIAVLDCRRALHRLDHHPSPPIPDAAAVGRVAPARGKAWGCGLIAAPQRHAALRPSTCRRLAQARRGDRLGDKPFAELAYTRLR